MYRLLVPLLLILAGCQRGANAPDGSSESVVGRADRATTAPAPESSVPAANDAPQISDLDPPPDPVIAEKNELARQRDKLDTSVWAKEVLAQAYEQAFVRVWDDLLAQERIGDRDGKYDVLRDVPFNVLTVGTPLPSEELDWGIRITPHSGENATEVRRAAWHAMLDSYRRAGYELVQSEFHHAKFDPHVQGHVRSSISFALYGRHASRQERVILKGNLVVVWQPGRGPQGLHVPYSIDATDIQILRRQGETPFERILTIDHAQPATKAGVQPVLVYDLDGDGLSEICLGGSNELLHNQGDGEFDTQRLTRDKSQVFETGVIADFDGDAQPDYIVPATNGDLLLYAADEHGKFEAQPVGKTRAGGPLVQPQALTAGDIDGDGDLDLWLAQYKISYVGGQMPTPYFDANDGFPAYLLINDGHGRFEPATEESGLAKKRFRRTYGSSFLDFDVDGDLDLLVVSDFSGIDCYENDGQGYFSDITDDVVDERHLFGMSATFGDYNLDGELDFFVTGMASTTARRLDYMKLGRRDAPNVHMMRGRMGYGNRMYVAQGNNRFAEPGFRDQVARTGWAWGSTSLDFDNDGDKDLFIANGHASGESTKDHCTQFWCHDIYTRSSDPDPAMNRLFTEVHKGYFDRSESWDGYQKNVLLMNVAGERFESVAFLLGVGQQYDGRAVVGDDIDNDGRVDLVVVEDRWLDGQLLHVYRNRMPTDHHWIGVRLKEEGVGKSPQGARVVVHVQDGPPQVGVIVTGDSIHAQHPTKLHFGLGSRERVESIEVIWPGGHRRLLEKPAIDRYHEVLYGKVD